MIMVFYHTGINKAHIYLGLFTFSSSLFQEKVGAQTQIEEMKKEKGKK